VAVAAISAKGWCLGGNRTGEERGQVQEHRERAGKNKDLASDAVTSPKVANGSLLGEDFAAGQLSQGPQGEPGQNGATNVIARNGDPAAAPADSGGTARAFCDSGERATGGGFAFLAGENPGDIRVINDGPITSEAVPTGWRVEIRNDDRNLSNDGEVRFFAQVVCASP
jgi:hypothetical protein